jgi:kalirin
LFIGTNFNFRFSDEARALGFTVLVDMRGATWSTVKPILKALHEHFPPGAVHQALIVKPDNFWQKQRTSLGSHKYKFEVKIRNVYFCMIGQITERFNK